MINVITELSKYVILTLMIVYTFHCFYMVWRQDEEEQKELLQQQLTSVCNQTASDRGGRKRGITGDSCNDP